MNYPFKALFKSINNLRNYDKNMQKMAKERVAYTVNDFVRSCEDIHVGADIAQALWQALREEFRKDDYKPKLEDEILNTLCMDEEDFFDSILEPVLIACHIKIPPPSKKSCGCQY